ncbi:MAG: peptidoglycan editing factor PgeF [Balneolaceae bacterium]
MNIERIRPAIFDSISTVEAFFTPANRSSINLDGAITGLNLGNNTDAPEAEILQNFALLFDEQEAVALAEQVHGSDVVVVDSPGLIQGVDGLVTRQAGLTIGIKVADCAALLIADPENDIVAALHAGWRGAADGIVATGVSVMKELGGNPSAMRVYISPCISAENFEVGEEVAARFPESAIDRSHAKPHIDLKKFLKDELLDAGIPFSQIECDQQCTVGSDRFYSYRREGSMAGRMLGYIKLMG